MKIENCTKEYDGKLILDDISFEFEQGNIYWLNGANGTGKSTLVRCLIGAEKFTNGQLISNHNNLLFIPECEVCEKWLTIQENIEYIYTIFKKKQPEIDFGVELDIENKDFNDLSLNCSTGTNMKVGFSLLYTTEVWDIIIIDEAFSHLDTNVQKKICNKLLELAKAGSIIIFTHHDILDNEFTEQCSKLYLEAGKINKIMGRKYG